MITCEACGNQLPDGTMFCTACGARLDAPPVGSSRDPAAPAGAAPEGLTWLRKIPLITNPYLVLQCIGIPFLIALVMGGFLSLITGAIEMLEMFLLIGAGLAILMLIIMVVLQLVTGGGLETEFFISNEGVAHKAGKTTRSLDRASTVGSVVLGSMGGTGAGLIAMSQEFNILSWQDVRYISVYPAVRSLVFRSQYLIGPVVLYCTEENFIAVQAMAKKFAPGIAAAKL